MSTLTPAATTAPSAPTEWENYRLVLQTLRTDCLRERDLVLTETVASHPDLVAVNRAATLLSRVREIDAALERIADGTYGTCVHCGAAIPSERLDFRAYAAGCVACPPSAG